MNDHDHPLLGPLLTLCASLDLACSRFGLDRATVRQVRAFASPIVPSAILVAVMRHQGPEAAAAARDAYLLAYTDRSKRQTPPRPKPRG